MFYIRVELSSLGGRVRPNRANLNGSSLLETQYTSMFKYLMFCWVGLKGIWEQFVCSLKSAYSGAHPLCRPFLYLIHCQGRGAQSPPVTPKLLDWKRVFIRRFPCEMPAAFLTLCRSFLCVVKTNFVRLVVFRLLWIWLVVYCYLRCSWWLLGRNSSCEHLPN